MYKLIFAISLFFCSLLAGAQKISVESFQLNEQDLTANQQGTIVLDQNGEKCALIRVQTTQTGFSFDVGSLGVSKVDYKTAEVWVYVPHGVRKITIRHQLLGTTEYAFPINIERARTYKMQLTTGEVQTIVKNAVTSQYVLFRLSPANAFVELDGQIIDVVDGTATKRMPFGTYNYKVQAPRHAPEVGTIVVNDPKNKHIVTINLRPQFGNVKFQVANNAEIWIDDKKQGIGNCTVELGYGTYVVECRLPGHRASQKEISITQESVNTPIILAPPTPIYGSLDINSTPADAEVWLDDKQVGTTPLFLSECLVGEHKLKVSKLGYQGKTTTILVAEGQTTTSSITLDKGMVNNGNSSNLHSDDIRIMQFLREGVHITENGTAIDSKGSTTFEIKVVDDNHFSIDVYGATAFSSFSNKTLVMKLSNGKGVVTNDELRKCRYNSFSASFTITGNKLTVYLSYTTAAYSSFSVKREYTLKDSPAEVWEILEEI